MTALTFDTDDVWEGHDRLDLLVDLKLANPLFRMTAFAVPGRGSDEYWESLPDWISVAAHGWLHPDAHEAQNWTYEEALEVLLCTPLRFVELWKSPGWLISEGTYRACDELGWAIADQRYNDHRRPFGIRTHCEGEGNHVHTHVDNVCGNGLEETFPELLAKVEAATSFDLIVDIAKPWIPEKVAA